MWYAKSKDMSIYVCSDQLNVLTNWIERSNGVLVRYAKIPYDIINEDKVTYIAY